MHNGPGRALVDGQPVPSTLTPAQVMMLFPRGVVGLRVMTSPTSASPANGEMMDDYVFPLADGTLFLTPGVHYTLAPPGTCLADTSVWHADRPPYAASSHADRLRPLYYHNHQLNSSSSGGAGVGVVPTRRPEVFAFTPPVPEDDRHLQVPRQPRRQPSQDLSQPTPAMRRAAAARQTDTRLLTSPEVHAPLRVEREASMASSVSEIMEDGPSVGHLLTDLCIDSTTGPSQREHDDEEESPEEDGMATAQNWDHHVERGHRPAPRDAEEEEEEEGGDHVELLEVPVDECDLENADDGQSLADDDVDAPTVMRCPSRDAEQARDMQKGSPQNPGIRLQRPGKLVQDRVHEHVLLPMLAIDIVDTPEFQRLRSLKQLGTTVYLYPGATHTRFEHCIGVAHLASQMVRSLAARQPELRITTADLLCVTVAGLCHDIGHGPFSHLFEQVINRMRRDQAIAAPPVGLSGSSASKGSGGVYAGGAGTASTAAAAAWQTPHRSAHRGESGRRPDTLTSPTAASTHSRGQWHHESMSIQMLRTILGRMDLEAYGLNDADARFIELCILGLPPSKPWPEDIGRPPHKRFLVDIVANKRHGIDVDKLDYFLRDSLGVYGKAAADVHFPRLLSACRVLPFDGQYQICYEEKLALNLGDIFTVRAKLHKYAYQHRIVKVIDYMVSDALAAADPYFLIAGSDGRPLRISESVDDQTAFCKLGDWILDAIAASSERALQPARDIIRRLTHRDLYPCVGQATFGMVNLAMKDTTILEELVALSLQVLRANDKCLTVSDEHLAARLKEVIIVSITSITYGSSDSSGTPDDPINNVTFYNPKNPAGEAFKLPANRLSPLFSPSAYQERTMMILVRDSDYAAEVSQACSEWKRRKQSLLSVAVPNSNARGSPVKRPRDTRSRQPSETPFKPRRLERDAIQEVRYYDDVESRVGGGSGELSTDGARRTVAAGPLPPRTAYGAVHPLHTGSPRVRGAETHARGHVTDAKTESRAFPAVVKTGCGVGEATRMPSGPAWQSDLIPNPQTFPQQQQDNDSAFWYLTPSSSSSQQQQQQQQTARAKQRLADSGELRMTWPPAATSGTSSQVLSGGQSGASAAHQHSRGVPPMLHTARGPAQR